MPELRLRGEDMQLRLTRGKAIVRTYTAIESMEWIINTEIIQKGYLGEGADRFDEIYRGTSLNMQLDVESEEAFQIMETIARRAQSRSAADYIQINGIFVANLANGKRPRVTVIDLKFADPSIGSANREAYVAQRLNGKSSKFKVAGV
jgi:hypothetical protein